MEAKDPEGVEKYLQHEFSNKGLLHEALRHSSYVNEMAQENLQDNERLEFLGDAVINLIVGHPIIFIIPLFRTGSKPVYRIHPGISKHGARWVPILSEKRHPAFTGAPVIFHLMVSRLNQKTPATGMRPGKGIIAY